MIPLETSAEGVRLPVLAKPGSKRNAVAGEHDGRLKVQVTAPPEKGKANDALQDVIAEALGLKRSQVSLASGASSARKTFLVTGVDAADLRSRVQQVCG